MENQQTDWDKIKKYIDYEYEKYVKPPQHKSPELNYTFHKQKNATTKNNIKTDLSLNFYVNPNYTFKHEDFLEV